MRRTIGPWAGAMTGFLVGLGALLAIGAVQGGRSYPRYSVASEGTSLLITDNDREELFVYGDAKDEQGRVSRRMQQRIDLSSVGQRDLRPAGRKRP